MTVSHALVNLGLAAAAMVVAASAGGERSLRADLGILAGRTIFFGHQSVGGNVLDGLRSLASEEGVALRTVEVPAATGLPAGTLGHALVARNGDPLMKLRSFEAAFGAGPGPDVALVKLCYVDFGEGTDVAVLFERYRETIARLRARFPRTAFVHVTAPLVAGAGGARGALKRLLGRDPAARENARREEYSALLRRAYGGKEPIFDLARVESTWPDGREEALEQGGRKVPALVPAYTSDGGHLAGEGARRAARELAAVLAAVPVTR